MGLPPNPVCTLFRDGPLCQSILEPNLEFRPEESFFLCGLGDVEFANFSPCPVDHFTGNKGRRREDELETIDLFEFLLVRLEGLDRKARCRNCDSGTGDDRPL